MMRKRTRCLDTDLYHFGRQPTQYAQLSIDCANICWSFSFYHYVAYDPALAGMNDAAFGAVASLNFARDDAHAARSAMSCATIERQSNAVVQRGIQQKLAALSLKAFSVYRNSMASCHFAIPEGSKLLALRSKCPAEISDAEYPNSAIGGLT
jgi:hypothetical protein